MTAELWDIYPAKLNLHALSGGFPGIIGREVSAISSDNLMEYFKYLRTEYKPNRFSDSEKPLSDIFDNYWIALKSLNGAIKNLM